VFEIDMPHCPNCGGRLKIIAVTLQAPVIEKILTRLRTAGLRLCGSDLETGDSPQPAAVKDDLRQRSQAQQAGAALKDRHTHESRGATFSASRGRWSSRRPKN
jgi:hypothetical protein